MLSFNHRGFLVPNNNIGSTIEELKSVFVDELPGKKRIELYECYIRYCNELKTLLNGVAMRQWVDGSFVTRKREPDDIDMVTFIDGSIVEQLGERLDPFKYPASLDQYGVDAYIVATRNRDDRKYPIYIADSIYWMDAFDKTQRSRNGLRHPKGFLEIIY